MLGNLREEIEESKQELAQICPSEFLDQYELRFKANSPKRISPSKHPLKMNKREEPTLDNTFNWSSTYIPYYDKIANDNESSFDIVDP